ncbi:hypothetical protein [Enterococcus faecium]|uniref:hypothetical protein n=1 Tax=Enterococcus TaxID=1350 RepID=UPI0019115EA1|nr:hypothetical protein [Enterococcus faecium]MBK5028361.1 hypothetical protein [Enterococcus faecium]MBK5039001.1 hypothetical protein [Enterococcus faecium]MBK5044075.1 hypothetical protein [Enterococcus faecium]MBK5068940.1 hypothetical protein [Enterococcus faecium]MBK5132313.1 hypothetical protein [Enterococcus faecium]
MILLYRNVLIVGMGLKILKKEQLFKVKERHNQLLCSKTGTMNVEYRTEYLELMNRTDFLSIREQQEQEKLMATYSQLIDEWEQFKESKT